MILVQSPWGKTHLVIVFYIPIATAILDLCF